MTDLIDFGRLQPEYFTNEQTWLDFFEALAEVLEEEIRSPIKELEDVRHFVETTDPFILSNTIKTLGFDLPADLIQHNIERLSKSIYMLSMFHEISGVEGFTNSIAYVLGREVRVTGLYTNNYVDFYPEPKGPLLKNGGDWYATTHISLGMELIATDRNLVLPIGKTLADRLIAAYFEFASVTEVIHDFYFITKIQAQLQLSAKVHVNPTRFRTVGQGAQQVNRVVAYGPEVIESFKTARFFADIGMGNSPCFDISQIAVGFADSIESDADISALELIDNGDQSLTRIVEDQYLWLAAPAELGVVTFTDQNGFEGGWDGASWGDEVGTTTGPIQIQRTIDNQLRTWNVYRTDFKNLGPYTFNVSFQYDRDNSCEYIDPVGETPQEPIPLDPDPGCTTTQIQLLPLFGMGAAGINTAGALSSLQTTLPNTNNTVLDETFVGYGYFAYPAALGFATFTDTQSTFEGGWDGASWPSNGDIGEDFGPISIMRQIGDDTVEYYLYRTDFPDIGAQTFAVTFTNPGQVLYATEEDCVSSTCVADYPAVATGAAGLSSDAALTAAIDTTLSMTTNALVTMASTLNEYVYFLSPKGLGEVTFGSLSWTAPIEVSRVVNGYVSPWYVYRTTTTNIASTSVSVMYEHAGRCVVTAPPAQGGECLVSSVPRYGSGYELYTSAHIAALTPLPSTQEETFNIVVNSGEYGYFAAPAALGKVTFTDALGFEGGWDGARWPVDTISSASGPTLVMRNEGGNLVPWQLYRTDFQAIGAQQFTVSYQRDLNVGDTADCNTSMPNASDFITGSTPLPAHFAIFGTAPIGLDSDFELLQLQNAFTTNANQVFSINVPNGQYGYFAHPSHLGIARFIDQSAADTKWNGASWPLDGSVGIANGPIAVLRNIGGVLQTWYVYRTDFPGVGSKQYRVEFGYAVIQDGASVLRLVNPVWTTDRPDLVTFDDMGVATFGSVTIDTIVQITATYDGISDTISVLLVAKLPKLLHMTMSGQDTIIGGQSALYGLEGFFSDGFYRSVAGAKFSVLSQYAHFVNNTLFTTNAPQDTELNIQAEYTNSDNIKIYATKQVLLKHVQTVLHVVDFDIVGPDTIQEKSSVQYVAQVLYSNGTVVQEQVKWESSSAGLYIDQQGLATAGSPAGDFDAVLTATYQFNGVKSVATKNVSVRVLALTPVSLTISGQNSLLELSSAEYTAILTWSNGTNSIVTANWTSSRFSINAQGVLTSGSVGGTTTLAIQAQSNGLTASKIVSVYNTPINIEHIQIVGPDNLNEHAVGVYRVLAHYNDGRDFEITATLSVTGSPDFVTLTGNNLSFTEATESIIELVATYDDNGTIFTQRKQIVLVPEISLIVGLSVFGPSEVLESKRIALSAIAIYSDGTTNVVEPTWSLESADPTNIPEVAADIVAPGVVQGRIVDANTGVIVVARYFKETARFPVLVKNYAAPGPDVPISYRIEGPDEITTNATGSYTLYCVFENCPDEIALSNDWALDVAPTIAVINQNGYLRSINKLPAVVEVTATWEFNGHAIQATKVVNIVDAITITSLVINGPSNVDEQTTTQYTAEYFVNNIIGAEGEGYVPEDGTVTWTVTGSPLATITDDGELVVGDLDVNTNLIITAVYDNGRVQLTASQPVIVAGAPPLVVSHNLIGGNSVYENGTINFVVEVFRANMPTTSGTGIVVPPSSLVYSVTTGTINPNTGAYTAGSGASNVVLTINGQFENYTIAISHNISVLARAPSSLTLTGPASITSGTTGQYNTELFLAGLPTTPGSGIQNSPSVVFSLENEAAGISISASGLVTVPGNVDDTTFTVVATVGTIVQSMLVTVPSTPLFGSIKSIHEMNITSGRPVSQVNSVYPVDGENTVVIALQDATTVKAQAYDTVTYTDAAAKLPTQKATQTLANMYAQSEYSSEAHGQFVTASKSNVFASTRYAGSSFVDIPLPADITTITYPYGPVNAAGARPAGRPTHMTTAQGDKLLLIGVWFQSMFNGYYVSECSCLRVYKLVGTSYVHVQDIFDHLGTSAYVQYQVSGMSPSYSAPQFFNFEVEENGTLLTIGTFAYNGTHTPYTSIQQRRMREDYFNWDGNQFARILSVPKSLNGHMNHTFYRLGSRTFVITNMILNISVNTSTAQLVVRELSGSVLVQRQAFPSSQTGWMLSTFYSDVKKLFVIPAINGSKGVSVFQVNQSTGALTLLRTLTFTDCGLSAADIAQIYGAGNVFVLNDGKTVGFTELSQPVHDAVASRIWLLEG